LLRGIGCRFGEESQVSEGLYIHDGRNFSTGPNCRFGVASKVWDFESITIGRSFLGSHNLILISASHRLDSGRGDVPGPIVIGANVWAGINVTIVGPVTVGDNVVIGANSLVTSDLAANGVYAGAPAKLIRTTDLPAAN